MSISERLEQAKRPVKPKFEQWIDGLDEVDRQALEAAAVDPLLSNRVILAIVREGDDGYPVNKDTIAAWRKAHGFTR